MEKPIDEIISILDDMKVKIDIPKAVERCGEIIQDKINALKENTND